MIEERYTFLIIKKESLVDFPKYLDYVFIEYSYFLKNDELLLLDNNNNFLKYTYLNREEFRKILEELRNYVCL